MKNRHGVDVRVGQVWLWPRLGDGEPVECTVKGIYPCQRGHSVILGHAPLWGHTEAHVPLSSFANRPKSRVGLYLKPKTRNAI